MMIPVSLHDHAARSRCYPHVSADSPLIDLAKRPGKFMVELVPDPGKWAKAAGDARNALAHVGPSDQALEDLYAVVRVTEAIVILNLLHELGVPEERLQKAIRDHHQLAHAAMLGNMHFDAAPAPTVGNRILRIAP